MKYVRSFIEIAEIKDGGGARVVQIIFTISLSNILLQAKQETKLKETNRKKKKNEENSLLLLFLSAMQNNFSKYFVVMMYFFILLFFFFFASRLYRK